MTLTEEQIKEIAEKHSSNDYVRSIAELCIREALELAEKENAEALRSHEALKALDKIVKEWNNSPKPCRSEARRLIPEVLEAIESAQKG